MNAQARRAWAAKYNTVPENIEEGPRGVVYVLDSGDLERRYRNWSRAIDTCVLPRHVASKVPRRTAGGAA